ncbi:MAG: hypothetical protein IJA71_02465 [Clostridia bacterium]|nr:hypothetical protein [Clostridia bacterium]
MKKTAVKTAVFFETVKELPVGADVLIGPFPNASFSPKKTEGLAFHRRGDEGIAPYDRKKPAFFVIRS